MFFASRNKSLAILPRIGAINKGKTIRNTGNRPAEINKIAARTINDTDRDNISSVKDFLNIGFLSSYDQQAAQIGNL